MTDPGTVVRRLADIENDLALRQNAYEQAARNWVVAKRDKEKHRAEVFLTTEGTVAERSAHADKATAWDGKEAEAEFEAMKAVMRTLETRASIGQSILRSMK